MTVIGQTQSSQTADEGSGGLSEPPEQMGQNVGVQNNNTINIRNNRPPPGYPCSEACIACGKKASEASVEGGTTTTSSTTEEFNPCPCECHKQIFHPALEGTLATQGNQVGHPTGVSTHPGGLPTQPSGIGIPTQPPMQGLPAHIPPGGPDCLPGCGYSGLPCYNCSLRPVPQPSQANTPLTNIMPPNANATPTFTPHVFTVELQDGMVGSGPSNGLDPDQVIIQGEEDPRARKRRRTCLSILIAIIAVNVAFQMFKLI